MIIDGNNNQYNNNGVTAACSFARTFIALPDSIDFGDDCDDNKTHFVNNRIDSC